MRIRLLVSAAALAATTLAPLTVAGPADAVRARTWSRLAHCESGGRWHINTGNGYYGGLQISGSTWRAYGGHRYAAVPSRASRHQQVKVARKIKRHQGWGAWPACSARLGLR